MSKVAVSYICYHIIWLVCLAVKYTSLFEMLLLLVFGHFKVKFTLYRS